MSPVPSPEGLSKSVVRLREVVCVLDRFPAIAAVDLDVGAGDVVLVSGPNGAGKTTLLRVIAGLLPLQRGTGEVLGHDLTDATARRLVRRELALVGHETGCYDELTVRENLTFALRATGRERPACGPAIDAALSRFGLTRVASQRFARLSAGQRRRLALARAAALAPRLVLLDEPHAALDADGRAALDRWLAETSEQGCSIVLASHELDRARLHATHEVTLENGSTRRNRAVGKSVREAVR